VFLSLVGNLVCGRGEVVEAGVQAGVVVPVDLFDQRELDGGQRGERAMLVDDFGLG
jgi:hypothetical protein